MKYLYYALFSLLLLTGCGNSKKQSPMEREAPRLSMQSYTFHRFTLVEAIDKANELGVRYLEVYPKQKLGGDLGEEMFNYDLSPELRKGILEYAAMKNIKLVATGVLVPKREELEKIFAFANEMGMEYITAEPAREDWNLVEELAEKYQVGVATHNHPSENSYWKPQELLAYVGDRSELLGAAADIGHYKRMGLDPLDCLKQLEGRLVSLHFKDLSSEESGYGDVVWGTGVLELKEILEELKRQGFGGHITIEYEAEWDDNVPSIRRSIEYFNQIADEVYN